MAAGIVLLPAIGKNRMEADNNNSGNVQQYTDKQQWLIRYLVAKMGVSEQQVKDAIAAVGDDQNKIEEHLLGKSPNG